MTIGYVNPEYGAMRNIVNKCPDVDYVRVRSFKSLKEKVCAKIGLKCSNIGYVYYGGVPERLTKIDLIHFWNNVAVWPCCKPYITTFEDTVPRKLPKSIFNAGIESLLSSRCRRLIAFSERCRRQQVNFNRIHGIGELDSKITVLLPPQDVLVAPDVVESRKKHSGGAVRFIFIGQDFFRKGGGEIVRALVKVRRDFQVEAYLIGDYSHVDYASSWEVDSADEMRRLCEENCEWLHHFNSMPNSCVMELAKTCHVGLLPTRDDTFGYSVLEFQGCGLPCITTDSCSLPEVNNDRIGWMIVVPKTDKSVNRAEFSDVEKMRELSRQIEKGLYEKMVEIVTSPDAVVSKGLLALNHIVTSHSPIRFGERLKKLYAEAMNVC